MTVKNNQIIDEKIIEFFQKDDFIKIIDKCYESNIGKNDKINNVFTKTYIETLYMHLNLYMMSCKNQDIDIKNLKEVIDNICVFVLIYSFFKGKYNTGESNDYKTDIYNTIKKLLNQLNIDKFKELIESFNSLLINNDTLGIINTIDVSSIINDIEKLKNKINEQPINTEIIANDDNKTLLNVFKMKIMYEIFLFEEDKINTLIDVIINEKS